MNSRSFNLHRDSSNSITLSNVGELFWSWIPEKPYPSSEWERKFHSSLFTSSITREIRHFLVVVLQWRQRNVQKSVMHVHSCCFANPNLLFFLTSRCRRRHRILRSLLTKTSKKWPRTSKMWQLLAQMTSRKFPFFRVLGGCFCCYLFFRGKFEEDCARQF